jgi:hypothetical protein
MCKHISRAFLNCDKVIDDSVWSNVPIPATVPVLDDDYPPPMAADVEAAIGRLKNYSAGGVCCILLEMLKYGGDAIRNWLHRASWQLGTLEKRLHTGKFIDCTYPEEGQPHHLRQFQGHQSPECPRKSLWFGLPLLS